MMSVSETTPSTLPLSTTGTPEMPLSDKSRATSRSGVLGLTVRTFLVISCATRYAPRAWRAVSPASILRHIERRDDADGPIGDRVDDDHVVDLVVAHQLGGVVNGIRRLDGVDGLRGHAAACGSILEVGVVAIRTSSAAGMRPQ